MAFCNSCGTAMEAGAKFCPKCGAAAAAPAAASPAVSSTPAAPAQGSGGSSALKIILIILGIIVLIAILAMATCGYIIYRAKNKVQEAIAHSEVRERNGKTKVETPFGNIESSEDADEAISDLGVAVYPGAEVVKGTSSTSTIGNMHTATAEFDTSDSTSAVADFYKTKLPNANFMSSEGRYTIIAGDKGNLTTINIEPKDGKTRIHIAKIKNAPGSGVTSN